jgi:hypothetical protein
MSSFLFGLLLGSVMILPIGVQSLFVINQEEAEAPLAISDRHLGDRAPTAPRVSRELGFTSKDSMRGYFPGSRLKIGNFTYA